MRPNLILVGQWMFDQDQRALWTAWSSQKMLVFFGDVAEAKLVHVAVHARSRGRIPPSYTAFLLDMRLADATGTPIGESIGTVSIPASDADYQVGVGNATLQPGTSVYLALVWINDSYDPAGGFDTNFMLRDVIVF